MDFFDFCFELYLVMVYLCFSMNIFFLWDCVQLNCFMSYNGEINMLCGNCNWMWVCEGVFSSLIFGKEFSKCYLIVEFDCLDLGSFDNVLEFLFVNGCLFVEGVMMMIFEVWQNYCLMLFEKCVFYEYYFCLMELWDGLVLIVFIDGQYIGVVFDCNGLWLSCYVFIYDDVVVMVSEIGVVDIELECVCIKG